MIGAGSDGTHTSMLEGTNGSEMQTDGKTHDHETHGDALNQVEIVSDRTDGTLGCWHNSVRVRAVRVVSDYHRKRHVDCPTGTGNPR